MAETVVTAAAGGGLGIRAGRAVAACRDGDLRRLSPTGAPPPVASFAAGTLDEGAFSLSFNDSYKFVRMNPNCGRRDKGSCDRDCRNRPCLKSHFEKKRQTFFRTLCISPRALLCTSTGTLLRPTVVVDFFLSKNDEVLLAVMLTSLGRVPAFSSVATLNLGCLGRGRACCRGLM